MTNLGVEVLETRQHLQGLIHQSINVSQVLHSDVPLTFSLEKSKVNIFRANLTLYITVCSAGFHEKSNSKAEPTKVQNQYPLKSFWFIQPAHQSISLRCGNLPPGTFAIKSSSAHCDIQVGFENNFLPK